MLLKCFLLISWHTLWWDKNDIGSVATNINDPLDPSSMINYYERKSSGPNGSICLTCWYLVWRFMCFTTIWRCSSWSPCHAMNML